MKSKVKAQKQPFGSHLHLRIDETSLKFHGTPGLITTSDNKAPFFSKNPPWWHPDITQTGDCTRQALQRKRLDIWSFRLSLLTEYAAIPRCSLEVFTKSASQVAGYD